MKRAFIILAFFFSLFTLTGFDSQDGWTLVPFGCSGSDTEETFAGPEDATSGDPSSHDQGDYIKFTGHFDEIINPDGTPITLNVSKAVVIYSDDAVTPEVFVVNNGALSIQAEYGMIFGLIFLDYQDRFIGYLTLGKGIDFIPLTKVSGGVGSIDLDVLRFDGPQVIPAYNPIGYELPYDEDELADLSKQLVVFVENIRHPRDDNGNGIPDILENLE